MAIPTRYRQSLLERDGGSLVMTIDTEERCLRIYPLAEWLPIEETLNGLPGLDHQSQRISRLLVGYAMDLELDANGRVVVPPKLREYAGLTKACVLLGQGKKLELWCEERWNKRQEEYLAQSNETHELPAALQTLVL